MDPLNQPTSPNRERAFVGAAQDAEILRARLNDLFNLAPEGSVIQDPQRRAKLATASEHVAELTAVLATVQATIPGRLGRVFGVAVSGVEKDPGTGKVRPGVETTGNFAPSPVGFLDPTAVGLRRNWWIPGGMTQFVPESADRLGLGLPEQRAEDLSNKQRAAENAATSQVKMAANAVAGESEGTLQDLIAGRGGFSRSGVLIATSGATLQDLRTAAEIELARRAGRDTPVRAPGATPPVIVPAIVAATGAASGPDAATLRPVNDAGKRYEATAQGIQRDLIHERADP